MPIRRFVITGLVALASLQAAASSQHGGAPTASAFTGIMESLLGLAVLSVALPGGDPHLSAEERRQVLRWLDESRREFLAALDGLSDAQWNWKPAPESWSVGETAEHVVLAEALLFGFVGKAMAGPPNPEWEEQTKGKTEFLIREMPSRRGKGAAPKPIVPRGGLTRGRVREQFERQRLEIEQFASENRMGLKEHTVVHPFPVLGTLNAYQWLIYVPLHTMRHDRQIAQVKETEGYPTNSGAERA